MLAQCIFCKWNHAITPFAPAVYSSWDGAGVSPPDYSLINGWLPPASWIDILYTATHIAVRSEIVWKGNPANDTQVIKMKIKPTTAMGCVWACQMVYLINKRICQMSLITLSPNHLCDNCPAPGICDFFCSAAPMRELLILSSIPLPSRQWSA